MRKHILSLAILVVLLLSSAIFLPYLFKDQFVDIIKKELNQSLKGKIDFNSDLKINIFKSFPDLEIGIKEIIIYNDTNIFKYDTVLQVNEIDFSLDLKILYKDQEYIIKSIEIIEPKLSLELINDSINNWDIFNPSSKNDSELDFQLQKVAISNGYLSYSDIESNIITKFLDFNHLSVGVFNNGVLELDGNSSLQEFSVEYDDIIYIQDWKAEQTGDITLDLNQELYSFNNNDLQINGLPIDINGTVNNTQLGIDFDIEATSQTSRVIDFLTLIPAIYKSDFEDVKSTGNGFLSATYNGLYGSGNYPSYKLDLKLKNGNVKYPEFPFALKDLNLDLNISSEQGTLDATTVDLKKFNLNINNNKINGLLRAKNLSNTPSIYSELKGQISLTDLAKAIPLGIKELSGKIDSDIVLDGDISDNTEGNINSLHAEGKLILNEVKISDPSLAHNVTLRSGEAYLNKQNMTVSNLDWTIDGNSFYISGYLKNYLDYYINGEQLYANVDLSSSKLNLNDFRESSEYSDSLTGPILLPKNITASFTSSIKQLIYDDLELENFKGLIELKDQQLILNNISSDILGGQLNLKGKYISSSEPLAALDITYSNISILNLFEKFSLVQSLTPIAKNLKGITFAKLSFSSPLNYDMSPKAALLNLSGKLNVSDIEVKNLKLVNALNTQLNTSKLNAESIDDILVKFNMSEGKLIVQPFKFKLNDAIVKLEGTSKIDGSIDYEGYLGIPGSYLDTVNGYANKYLENTPFSNNEILKTDYITMKMEVKGTVLDPKPKLDLISVTKTLKQSIKENVKEEIEEIKDEAEETAGKELDKLKEEGERKRKELEEELRKELEAKKKEAEEKIKKEVEEKKEGVKENARKKLKDILKREK